MHCVRTQYAIGQGGFHAGKICYGSLSPQAWTVFNWVYDFGTSSRGKKHLLSSNLKRWRSQLRSPVPKIDALFLSQLDFDHLNGLPLMVKRGIRVREVVLPQYTQTERSLFFLRYLAKQRTGDHEWYRELLQNPGVWLKKSLHAEKITFVASETETSPKPIDLEDLPANPASSGDAVWWGTADDTIRSGQPGLASPSGYSGMLGQVPWTRRWVFVPYFYQPASSAHLQIAEQALKICGAGPTGSPDALFGQIFTMDWRSKRSRLRKLYQERSSDIHLNSLCLYSGPGLPTRDAVWKMPPGGDLKHGALQPSWLGTGAMNFKTPELRSAFLRRYQKLLPAVGTLMAPKPGSARTMEPGAFGSAINHDTDIVLSYGAQRSTRRSRRSLARVTGGRPLVEVTERTTDFVEVIRL